MKAREIDNVSKILLAIMPVILKDFVEMLRLKHRNLQLHNFIFYLSMVRFIREESHRFRGRLYDLGCGDRGYQSIFSELGVEYFGVDWAQSAHDGNPDIEADLNCPIPLDSESADTVVSFSVLEHLNQPEVMLSEAHRLLKHDGNAIFQVPWQWMVHEEPFDFQRFTHIRLKQMFADAGFANIKVSPQSGVVTTLSLKINYATRRLVRGRTFIGAIIFIVLAPLWISLQLMAILGDCLDRRRRLETIGYFVTATK